MSCTQLWSNRLAAMPKIHCCRASALSPLILGTNSHNSQESFVTAAKHLSILVAIYSSSYSLHNFRYRCLILALIDVSEVLSQTLHACMNYERKKNLKMVSSSKYK